MIYICQMWVQDPHPVVSNANWYKFQVRTYLEFSSPQSHTILFEEK